MVNLAAWVARAGRSAAARPALGHGHDVVCTYGELASRVARIAGALRRDLDLAPGDRVGLVMKNSPAYVELLFAIWHAGLAAVPVNAKLHRHELAHILADSAARACFASPGLADQVAACDLPELRHLVETGERVAARFLGGEPLDLETVEPDALAWLFYTSGTTGAPKGAMLSHRNLVTMALNYFVDMDTIAPGDCILHAAPMSHGSGIYILPHVAAGACNVVPSSGGFVADEVFELIARWPGLTMFAAPTMVRRLTGHPAAGPHPNLKTIAYGGAPMYVEDSVAALDRFGNKLVQLYGQGESPMTITYLSRAMHAERDHPRWRARLGSVGIPQSAVQVRVAGEHGSVLCAGEKGEVLVRGDTVMLGYWNNEQATRAALHGGWLHTGDVGYFDDEGFLTLTDRAKDVIISGGANIYPREVEEVLLRADGVAEVSVVGRRDAEWGEVVVAYVVPEPGAAPTAAHLDRHCLDAIARFKRPRHYRFVDELPKNNYGKVLKTTLREREQSI